MNAQDNNGFKAVAMVTAVIGGIALAAAGTTAAFGAVHSVVRTDQSDRVGVDGVTELSVDASASNVSIRFADVDEAEMTVTGSDGRWTLERDGEELSLRSPQGWWGWDWSWFGDWNRDARVELVLPQELSGIDADLSLSSGGIDAEGEFGELDIDVSAGSAWVAGSARSLDAELSAGGADIELSGVREASFGVSAGEVVAELSGTAPSEVEISVSAGSLDLTLPDEAYDVRQDVSAGSLDNELQTASGARNVVMVDLSAGSVQLRAAD